MTGCFLETVLAVTLTLPPGSQLTVQFQDGVAPWPGYTGARDVLITDNTDPISDPSANYTLLDDEADGIPDKCVLLRFDVSAIPAQTNVTSATLHVRISNSTTELYPLYEMRVPWVHDQATWNTRMTGVPWNVSGARGEGTDRGMLPLSSVTGAGPAASFALNADGVSAVQRWVNDPLINHGVVVQAPWHRNAVAFRSCETGTASQRPRLEVVAGGTTFNFQNGVSPAPAYMGCTDTTIAGKLGAGANWDGVGLEVFVGPQATGFFLAFDLSALPPGTVARGGTIDVTVANGTAGAVPVTEALRAWTEGGANWTTFDGANTWSAVGGAGTGDHGTVPLVATGPVAVGPVSFTLTDAGVALVNEWLAGTKPNHGFAFIDYTFADPVVFPDSEDPQVAARPSLTLDVTLTDGGELLIPGMPDAGQPDAGTADAGSADAGSADAGSADAGSADAGSADAGSADAGSADAGSADAGEGIDGGPDADGGSTPDADGGQAPATEPSPYTVGCDCRASNGDPLVATLLLLAAAWWRRAGSSQKKQRIDRR